MLTAIYRKRVQKLVDALRSGEYKQGHEMLQDERGRMCCLGVGCEVFRLSTRRGKWEIDPWHDDGRLRFVLSGKDSSTELPAPVAEWFGFGVDVEFGFGVEVDPRLGGTAATILNDSKTPKHGFRYLAKAFERAFIDKPQKENK